MTSTLNVTNDTNHIVYCARAEQLLEKKNLIGYIREVKYSHGGNPFLMKTVYLDPEAKGQCQDIFIDIKVGKVSVFLTTPPPPLPT
jgi:hypothetical protein